MKTSELLKILPDKSKEEFLWDYYSQVKEGLKDANSSFSKFFLYMALIVIIYYGFNVDLITKISLGQINIDNVNLLKISTPLLFSFCYYFMFLNYVRYNELRIQYNLLLYNFTRDKNFLEEGNMIHSPIFPVHFIDFTLSYLFSGGKWWQILYSIGLFLPILLALIFAVFFIAYTIYNLPFQQLSIVSSVVASISGYFFLLTATISSRSESNKSIDRKLLKEFLEQN